MKIVLDTNIIISGLLKPNGYPGKIMQLVASGRIKLCYDSRIIAEYYNVMLRGKFGFETENIIDLLNQIKFSGIIVSPTPLNIELPDHDDIKFIEVGIASKVKYLVTGNIKHFPMISFRSLKILQPADFIKLYYF